MSEPVPPLVPVLIPGLVPALVDVAWLARRLGWPGLRVLDATWFMPADGRDAAAGFAAAHVPGALRFDIDAASDPDSTLPHMAPSAGQFAEMMAGLGLSDDDHLVFYDQHGLFSAARGWWLMRLFGHQAASVLDGGLPAWRRAGQPVEQGGGTTLPHGRFTATLQPGRVRDLAAMRANLASGEALVLDARSAARFDGREPEPRPGLRGGHIPGSRSLPYTTLLAPDGRMLPGAELRARFAAVGVTGEQPVVTTCGSGVSAAVLSLGLAAAGLPDGALYDGSWAEWGLDDEQGALPVDPTRGRGSLDRHPEGLNTRLVHLGRAGTRQHGLVNPPVHRGSTVLYESMAQRRALAGRPHERLLTYGLSGTPTHFALEDAVAAVEGGTHCQIVGSGLAAVTVPLLGCLSAGDHCLMPDSVYGPSRSFCDRTLARLNIATTYYDPVSSADALGALFRPTTRVLFLESPGSHSFELQDVPALAALAHARGATVLMDNTWGLQCFQPFRHGVDVSIQALTKYAGGHSDVLLGAITTNAPEHARRIRSAVLELGQYASPDDCWLTLRGLRTLGVRLAHQQRSGIEVARWFAGRPEVAEVLHPALPGAAGHELWRRDFTGAPSLFGVVFQPAISVAQADAMTDALRLFGIGASWGGYESLVLPTTGIITRNAALRHQGTMVRFHIGLEDVADLIADLEQGFEAFQK